MVAVEALEQRLELAVSTTLNFQIPAAVANLDVQIGVYSNTDGTYLSASGSSYQPIPSSGTLPLIDLTPLSSGPYASAVSVPVTLPAQALNSGVMVMFVGSITTGLVITTSNGSSTVGTPTPASNPNDTFSLCEISYNGGGCQRFRRRHHRRRSGRLPVHRVDLDRSFGDAVPTHPGGHHPRPEHAFLAVSDGDGWHPLRAMRHLACRRRCRAPHGPSGRFAGRRHRSEQQPDRDAVCHSGHRRYPRTVGRGRTTTTSFPPIAITPSSTQQSRARRSLPPFRSPLERSQREYTTASVQLSWSQYASPTAVGYNVYRGAAGPGGAAHLDSYSLIAQVSGAATTTFTDTGAPPLTPSQSTSPATASNYRVQTRYHDYLSDVSAEISLTITRRTISS